MECQVCGAEINRITATHLRGPKCKDVEGRRLTVAQYQEKFGKGSAGLTGSKKSPGPKRKSVLQVIESLDRGAIEAEIKEIDAEVDDLMGKKVKLLALADMLQLDKLALPVHRATTSPLVGNGDRGGIDPMLSAGQRPPEKHSTGKQSSLEIKMFIYLEASGSAGLGSISRGVGISAKDAQPILNKLVAEKKISLKNGTYSL